MNDTHAFPPVSKWAIASLLLVLFLAAIETTVLTTAMPKIIPSLGGKELYHWVFVAFMISSTVVTPFYGKLADRLGVRTCMLFAVGVFLVGSALCGSAQNMPQLIAFRALQGIGAAGLTGLTMIAFGVLFSPEERGSKQALTSTVWGVSCLVGPSIGALLVTYGSWRWIFWLNVPLGLLGTWLFYQNYPAHEDVSEKVPFDFKGGALMFPILLILMLCLSSYQLWTLAGYLVVAALLYLFLKHEKKVADPLVPLHFFQLKDFNLATLISFGSNITMFTALTYIPYYLQQVRLYTPLDSGYVLTPMIFCWPLCSAISGRLVNRLGFRTLIVCGCGLMSIGALFWSFTPDVPLGVYAAFSCFLGAGMGMMNAMTIILIQVVVKPREIGAASSTLNLFRNIGSALGVNTLGALQVTLLAYLGLGASFQVVFQVILGVTLAYFLLAFLLPKTNPAELAQASAANK